MTLDIKELRATCEAVTSAQEDGGSLFTGERARALTEFRRMVSPSTVLALLDDFHRQKFERDSAVAELHLLQQQLAAVFKAQDELANIATGYVPSGVLMRVDVLRKVGR